MALGPNRGAPDGNSVCSRGWLLNVYLISAATWAGVSPGWFIGGRAAAGIPVVGYGWIAVAVYGAIVAAGVAATHCDFLADAVDPTADAET